VVVDYLHVVRISVFEDETYAKLIIDSDAVLAVSVADERLQAIPGWHSKGLEAICGIEDQQLSSRCSLDVSKSPRRLTPEQPLGVRAPE
jgi:hypothetical protein